MKPLIKWAGGKARLAPTIAEALGPIERKYYEPFLGGAAVFLHLRSTGFDGQAVLTDTNERLINMYQILRDDCDGLLEALHALPKDDWRDRYYEMREEFNEEPPDLAPILRFRVRNAALFLWLNRHCFNGLYRENKAGRFNVPVGSYKTINFPSRERFHEVSVALQGALILCRPFGVSLANAGPGDVVYCDPPYVPRNTTANFVGYTKDGFGAQAQIALTHAAMDASARGARVVLSNHDLPVVREMYSGFSITALQVSRSISREGSTRAKVGEVLAVVRAHSGRPSTSSEPTE